eukprot:scaffold12304_cov121-Isochrysis_galbana.AAC.3
MHQRVQELIPCRVGYPSDEAQEGQLQDGCRRDARLAPAKYQDCLGDNAADHAHDTAGNKGAKVVTVL